jgi:hypothetical protein
MSPPYHSATRNRKSDWPAAQGDAAPNERRSWLDGAGAPNCRVDDCRGHDTASRLAGRSLVRYGLETIWTVVSDSGPDGTQTWFDDVRWRKPERRRVAQ